MPAHEELLVSDGPVRLFNTHIKSILKQPCCTLTDCFIQRAALLNTQHSPDVLIQSGVSTGMQPEATTWVSRLTRLLPVEPL